MKKNALLRTNFLICMIIVMGFVITSLISYRSSRGIFDEDVEHISSLSSEGIYHQIDSIFAKPIHISMTMANDRLLKSFLLEEEARRDDAGFIQVMRSYLLDYKEKYGYDSVFLVSDSTKRYYHYDNGVDRVLDRDTPENVWYYDFAASDQEYSLNIDNDEAAASHNEITIFINCKIMDEGGETLGVVGVGFCVDSLQAIFRDYEDIYHIKAYLTDQDGTIQVSTSRTGFERANLFEGSNFSDRKGELLSMGEEPVSFWYTVSGRAGFVVSRYVPNLGWRLIIDNDSSEMAKHLNRQFVAGMAVILGVVCLVLFVITAIVEKYNEQVVRLTVEKEKKHRAIFQEETEKIYESIYEIDITHNRAASEATESYFESLGVPRNTPYDEALQIISQKQIKEEHRQGYIATFAPENVMSAYRSGKETLQYDFMISIDGRENYYWMRITARIFYWDEDQSVRMFVYRQNIDAQKRQEGQMLEKMEMDSLTRLYNKAATQKYMQLLLDANPDRLCVFYILDIDFFKNVNDTHGHAAGDMVLAGFARVLKNQFRATDIVGRIGGDEFVALVPAPSREFAERKAQSLVLALHREFVDGSVRCTVSTSVGVAIAPEDGRDFETLYRNADAALYYTKEHGKNGYTVYPPSGASE